MIKIYFIHIKHFDISSQLTSQITNPYRCINTIHVYTITSPMGTDQMGTLWPLKWNKWNGAIVGLPRHCRAVPYISVMSSYCIHIQ